MSLIESMPRLKWWRFKSISGQHWHGEPVSAPVGGGEVVVGLGGEGGGEKYV